MSFSLFRAVHQSHHAHFCTERDEELWPFVQPAISRPARILSAVLELSVGLLYTPFLFIHAFLRTGSRIRKKSLRRRIWAELSLCAIVWIGIFTAIERWDLWRYFLWLYLAPVFLAANMQSLRKYIEHVGLTGSTVNSCTRSIVSHGWLGRTRFFHTPSRALSWRASSACGPPTCGTTSVRRGASTKSSGRTSALPKLSTRLSGPFP